MLRLRSGNLWIHYRDRFHPGTFIHGVQNQGWSLRSSGLAEEGEMKFKDYYATLEVERDASAEAIKKAYRRLARRYHPDVAKEEGSEERFKAISEAYQTLSDPDKRRAYDELGRHRPGEEFNPSPDWETRFWRDGGQQQEVDLADLFEQMGFSTRGTGARGWGRQAGDVHLRGQDLEVVTELTLEQAAQGTEVGFNLSVPTPQPDGRLQRESRSGRIRVPRGVIEGERLRVPGRGGAGIGGGAAGDLYLQIHLKPHPRFRAVGHDLYLDVPIAPWEIALGAEITLPSLDGTARVSVRPGMRNGQKLRLAGKGLPHRREGAGDLYGVLQIVMPAEISERERELFQQLAEASSFNPRLHLEGVPTDG